MIEESPPTARAPFIRLGLFGLLLVPGIALLIWTGGDWRGVLEQLTHVSPGLFFAAMSILPVVGFPIAPFYFYAGVAYGWQTGIPLCLAALAVNMTLSYFATRTLLREPIAHLMARQGRRLPVLRGSHNQFRATFLLRTVPGPPFPVQNYLLTLAGVPFGIYLPVSLVAQGMIASAAIVSSGLLTRHVDPPLLIAAGLCVLLITATCGSIHYRRRERKAVGADETKP